jgi:maleylacetate reductase
VLPRTVIYDPELTLTLPVEMSITSAINALAHAAEGLYSRDSNPITSLIAEEAIAAIAQGLPGVHANRIDIEARSKVLYGAWLAGSVLGTVGMALHHKLCHTLGGTFNLPHAATHTIVLPHALAYNAAAAPEAMRRIARALGTGNAPLGVYELSRRHGAPVALRDLGLTVADVDKAADIASANAYWNPRPVEREAIRSLLHNAFEGAPPSA